MFSFVCVLICLRGSSSWLRGLISEQHCLNDLPFWRSLLTFFINSWYRNGYLLFVFVWYYRCYYFVVVVWHLGTIHTRHAKKGLRTYAESKAPDQTRHTRSLIWELHCPLIGQCEFLADSLVRRSESANAQADMKSHCPQMADNLSSHDGHIW